MTTEPHWFRSRSRLRGFWGTSLTLLVGYQLGLLGSVFLDAGLKTLEEPNFLLYYAGLSTLFFLASLPSYTLTILAAAHRYRGIEARSFWLTLIAALVGPHLFGSLPEVTYRLWVIPYGGLSLLLGLLLFRRPGVTALESRPKAMGSTKGAPKQERSPLIIPHE